MNASTTRSLADYTSPESIIAQLQCSTTWAVLDELSHVLHQADTSLPDLRLDSRTAIRQELLTGLTLEFGAVFPQVRVAGLPRPRFALGRAAQPLAWLASFFPPTELIFFIVIPTSSTPESQQLVATLARLGQDQARLRELSLARTAEEMLILLGQFPLVIAEDLAKLQAERLQRLSSYAVSGSGHGLTRRQ